MENDEEDGPVTVLEHHEQHHMTEAEIQAGAIPVRVVRGAEQEAAAEFGSFRTIVLTGNEQPFRLLAQDRKRHKATVNCGGAANQSVFLGRQAQAASGTQGFQLFSGQSISYGAMSEVWCIPQAVNGAAILSVMEERYS